jgi:hypothetical protein
MSNLGRFFIQRVTSAIVLARAVHLVFIGCSNYAL